MKAELRAALIGLLILSQAIAAIPNPPELMDNALQDASAQAELDAWATTLRTLGFEADRESVFELAKLWNGRLKEGRKTLVTPFRPLLQLTGTGQGWGVFAFPDLQPYRFEIAILNEQGKYVDLYVDHVPETQEYASLLAYRRVRAIYNPGKSPAPAFKPFAEWLARDVFDKHPEARRVRVGFRRARRLESGEPHKGYVGGLRFKRVFTRERM